MYLFIELVVFTCKYTTSGEKKTINNHDSLIDVMKVILKNETFINIENGDTLKNFDSLNFNIESIAKHGNDSIEYWFSYEYHNKMYNPMPVSYMGIGIINDKIAYLKTGNFRLDIFDNRDSAKAFFKKRFKNRPDLIDLIE